MAQQHCREQVNQLAQRIEIARRANEMAVQVAEMLARSQFEEAGELVSSEPDESREVTDLKSRLLGEIALRRRVDAASKECARLVQEGRIEDARQVIASVTSDREDIAMWKQRVLAELDSMGTQ